MQKFTYHCHTDFSDGTSSVEEMIKRAVELGFTEIGITDHIEVHKNIETSPERELVISKGWDRIHKSKFSELNPAINQHIKTIREVAKKYPIDVLVGFEVDFFCYDKWLEGFNEFRKDLDIDYLISGNHFTTTPDNENVIFATSIDKYSENEEDARQYIRTHFSNIKKAIESGIFSFIAHLDFIRWSGAVGEFDYKDERMELIEALAKTGTPTEINTKGIKSIGDFYPAQWMLKEMNVRKIPIVISDDAHHTSQVGIHFDKAEEMLEAINYKHRFNLKHLIK
ncbi:MAG: histidinol-phosphatase HisJ family protein [Lactobacillus sp.]|jgi:histidinol-phosphatase (PHP family)|nr:histidinol-phosphatase HisJ family protein [Lactobacillus sp.]